LRVIVGWRSLEATLFGGSVLNASRYRTRKSSREWAKTSRLMDSVSTPFDARRISIPVAVRHFVLCSYALTAGILGKCPQGLSVARAKPGWLLSIALRRIIASPKMLLGSSTGTSRHFTALRNLVAIGARRASQPASFDVLHQRPTTPLISAVPRCGRQALDRGPEGQSSLATTTFTLEFA
jgi:hypothetical protein